MYNSDTDMLFPSRVIPKLRGLRGEEWKELVDQVKGQEATSPDHLGFVLLMIRLGGCASCHADSYRAMRGCSLCAQQTIRRYRGKDQELIEKFRAARQEMSVFMEMQDQD